MRCAAAAGEMPPIHLLYWYILALLVQTHTSTDAEEARRSGSGGDAPETTRTYSEFSAPSPQVLNLLALLVQEHKY